MNKNRAKFPTRHPYDLAIRYRRMIYQQFEQPYILSQDRDSFLAFMKTDLVYEISKILTDAYQMEIIRIYQRGMHMRKNLGFIMRKIEEVRKEYFAIHTASFDAKELFGLDDIDDFVEEESPREICRFLARQGVANYFLTVIQALENARKRGGLREREEMAILRKVKAGERMDAGNTDSAIGFKWAGIKSPQRIELLYHNLLKKGFINKQTSFENFKIIFSDQSVENPVTWLKTSKQLLLFIEAFLDKELISIPKELAKKKSRAKILNVKKARGRIDENEDNELRSLLHEINHWLYPLIGACFKNKKGISYSAKSLKHTRNDLFNKQKFPKAASEFENLANEVASI